MLGVSPTIVVVGPGSTLPSLPEVFRGYVRNIAAFYLHSEGRRCLTDYKVQPFAVACSMKGISVLLLKVVVCVAAVAFDGHEVRNRFISLLVLYVLRDFEMMGVDLVAVISEGRKEQKYKIS